MKKVVYNGCHGGCFISRAAIDRMIELGHPVAKIILNLYLESKINYSFGLDQHEFRIKRHDPILIQVVEELGDKANGECAKLRIEEMNDNEHYQITDYDGKEDVKILDQCDCC